MFEILNLFCAASFLGFGLSCVFSAYMVHEFARYGLARFRVMTGVLQLLGACGLAVGAAMKAQIGLMAAAGLSLLMLAGFVTRLKIKDSALQCLPSFAYMLLAAWLGVKYSQVL
jgi:hypothetical protein